ncbi:sigma-E factor negative regulatory protein [Variovorax sp. OV329]|uniref:sigma-E factor negative regulatory protein n=1 Tax=Variovorax sp. OV329 TaxID=1882825 RepID=UPI0008F3C580|nr:sigma-E factor negative regulatory protein [Variovorax sp. OV329]SFM09127.1 sigma-E factor negative regulatory protein RseA [Variovorax sp. OV329]
MNDSDNLREQVSALVDGQLRGDDFARAVEQVCGQEELRATWHAYHVVGDVLRTGEHVACQNASAFLGRFRERLAAEGRLSSAPVAVAEPVAHIRAEAANEPVFRWKLVAGIASVAAAAAIGWNWSSTLMPGSAGPHVAQQSSVPGVQQQGIAAGPVLASAVEPAAAPQATTATRVLVGNNPVPQVMLRDPRLDALLEAHQQAGGASHMPSGFLRNATFEGQSR